MIDIASLSSPQHASPTRRRNSSTNPMFVISEPQHKAAGAHASPNGVPRALHSQAFASARSRSNSRSRAAHSKKDTKALIKHEVTSVILRKLCSFLQEFGLQLPINVRLASPGKAIRIYVANSNDCIYLPPASSASFTYEDVENGGRPDLEQTLSEDSVLLDDEPDAPGTAQSIHNMFRRFRSPNYLGTKVDTDCPIPHTFAAIVELNKECTVKDLKFKFQSAVTLLWPSGDPYNKSFIKDGFKIGSIEWETTFDDADYYISTLNSNDVKAKEITLTDLIARTRNYRLADIGDQASRDGTPDLPEPAMHIYSTSHARRNSTGSTTDGSYTAKEGIYVFLLPLLLPEHIPATILSINGSLAHNLTVQFAKMSKKLNRKSKVNAVYELPMVRTAPSFANSIADKPIYVNRVWNDLLHYAITFPKKYVALGSEHQINVKLVPLVKDVTIKRIKFNVLERITYVSRDLTREQDYDGEDPFNLRPVLADGKPRERVVPICELRTKSKSSGSGPEPYKEEVIKCPENNLLFSCYEHDQRVDGKLSDVMVASPLDINIALPFMTTRTDKMILTSSGARPHDDELDPHSSLPHQLYPTDNATSRHSSFSGELPSSPVIGALETNLHHVNADLLLSTAPDAEAELATTPELSSLMGEELHSLASGNGGAFGTKENIKAGFTTLTKALYPDSNFRHIQIHHRLQACFRISKPDPKDNYKVHHYEVVVDTPLILLSSKCNEESVQLPKYDEIDYLRVLDVEDDASQTGGGNGGGVSFRTPRYNKNGISIKPLYDQPGEQLPSFEEATSPAASPVAAPIGSGPISRMASLTPSDQVPAYDVPSQENALPRRVSAEPPQEGAGSGSSGSFSSLLNLNIKSALSSSFAPADRLRLESKTSEEAPIGSPMALEPTLSSETLSEDRSSAASHENASTSTDAVSTTTNESGGSAVFDEQDLQSSDGSDAWDAKGRSPPTDIAGKPPQGARSAAPAPIRTLTSSSIARAAPASSGERDSVGTRPQPMRLDTGHSSIYTQDSYVGGAPISATGTLNFDQRLPLLGNCSVEEISRMSSSSSDDTDKRLLLEATRRQEQDRISATS